MQYAMLLTLRKNALEIQKCILPRTSSLVICLVSPSCGYPSQRTLRQTRKLEKENGRKSTVSVVILCWFTDIFIRVVCVVTSVVSTHKRIRSNLSILS